MARRSWLIVCGIAVVLLGIWGVSRVLDMLIAHDEARLAARAAEEDNIREAVFRDQFGTSPFDEFVYLAINGTDPSPQFMKRFAQFKPMVKPHSACWIDYDRSSQVYDKETGKEGIIIAQGEIRWLDDNSLEVEVSFYEAFLGAGGSTYKVIHKDGKWVVTDRVLNWIS